LNAKLRLLTSLRLSSELLLRLLPGLPLELGLLSGELLLRLTLELSLLASELLTLPRLTSKLWLCLNRLLARKLLPAELLLLGVDEHLRRLLRRLHAGWLSGAVVNRCWAIGRTIGRPAASRASLSGRERTEGRAESEGRKSECFNEAFHVLNPFKVLGCVWWGLAGFGFIRVGLLSQARSREICYKRSQETQHGPARLTRGEASGPWREMVLDDRIYRRHHAPA
jgi:hypothetical protein